MNTLAKHPNQNISTPFFIALTLMAMSLPLSVFMMSLMQFILLGFWAYEGYHDFTDFKQKSRSIPQWIWFPFLNARNKIYSFRNNKIALLIFSVYLMHLLGLFFTNDFLLAKDDLRTKLPILVLTLVIASSKPLNKTQFNSLLIFYIAAVLSGTFFGFHKFMGQNFTDVRELSVFIHPIRLGLNICFSVFLLIYFIYKNEFESLYANILFFVAIIWLIYFMILMESGMGLFTLFIISIGLLIYYTLKIKSIIKYLYFALILLIPFFIFLYINKIITEFNAKPELKFNELTFNTALGNPYIHDTLTYGVEDGRFVGLYICEKELKNAWNTRSNFDFEGDDKNGQELKRTLIRFLTSLDLPKDSLGISQLSDEYIQAIERGIANIRYLENPGIKTRIHKFLIGYQNYVKNNNPSGNPLIQRFEYWKAGIQIIKNNFWTGVGTGDIKSEFLKYYEINNSNLSIEDRRVSHNQYLSFMISFGMFGLIWFLFTLYYPFTCKSVRKDYYYIIFISIVLISMLSNDTLIDQAGISHFAFFNALLLFGRKSKKQQ